MHTSTEIKSQIEQVIEDIEDRLKEIKLSLDSNCPNFNYFPKDDLYGSQISYAAKAINQKGLQLAVLIDRHIITQILENKNFDLNS